MSYESMFKMMDGGWFGFGWTTYVFAVGVLLAAFIFLIIITLKK